MRKRKKKKKRKRSKRLRAAHPVSPILSPGIS
jgi:hypothetical protein